jgi:nucleotidyltransferase/DNA polymerase involved in DNA repair
MGLLCGIAGVVLTARVGAATTVASSPAVRVGGVVAAASEEARRAGVRVGQPLAQARLFEQGDLSR